MLYSLAVLSSFICFPPKINLRARVGRGQRQIISRREKESVPHATHRCWTGGIPSFSSTRSLMRSMESLGSISISISLPVSVFTLII